MTNYAIAIHGGAGTILKSSMTDEKEQAYKSALGEAIHAGETVLKNGGVAMDAVELAIISLENNPLFNAGKGAVFTNTGKNEMDASIMNGKDLMAGAVAGISGIKNPISLARAVMEKSEHVFLAGAGALDFAKKINAEFASPDYFFVPMRYDQLQKAKQSDTMILDHTEDKFENGEKKFGTVGAVALDVHGNLAAKECESNNNVEILRNGFETAPNSLGIPLKYRMSCLGILYRTLAQISLNSLQEIFPALINGAL
jgi:beta-aspartyl-peptidase (threonine type)